jgi:hypothetical protein
VTSDSPVLMTRHPRSPALLGAGVINSNFLVPIGGAAALDLKVPLGLKAEMLDGRERVRVKVRRVSRARLRDINASTVCNAERFVFAAFKSKRIAELFALTKKPKRFRVQSSPHHPVVMVVANKSLCDDRRYGAEEEKNTSRAF